MQQAEIRPRGVAALPLAHSLFTIQSFWVSRPLTNVGIHRTTWAVAPTGVFVGPGTRGAARWSGISFDRVLTPAAW